MLGLISVDTNVGLILRPFLALGLLLLVLLLLELLLGYGLGLLGDNEGKLASYLHNQTAFKVEVKWIHSFGILVLCMLALGMIATMESFALRSIIGSVSR